MILTHNDFNEVPNFFGLMTLGEEFLRFHNREVLINYLIEMEIQFKSTLILNSQEENTIWSSNGLKGR